MTDEPVVQVDNVAQRFGDRTIFRDVSLRVYPREVFVILGGSGSGKSTLLKQLIGLLTPCSAGPSPAPAVGPHCATCSAVSA
jgi:phospholipid/cholesterol/gamma-HCH transport system ATP-binding protein